MAHPQLTAAVEILRSLVAIDTTSHKSNLECIAYIETYLHAFGATCQRVESADKTKASLLATIGEAKDGGIVFSGHTDVVPVSGQDWATDPFELDERDGKLYARGTCDMKGFIACALAMAPYFKERASMPIHFAFSYDEEVGCLSAPELAATLAAQPFKPALAVIGEPTSMEVVDAHKSIASFVTRLTGLEGHSSNPEAGVNTINVAAEIVCFLNKLAAEQKKPEHLNPRFSPSYSTIHVGMIKGGTARNIIPNSSEIAWEIRGLPEADVAGIMKRFHGFCDEKRAHMRKTYAKADIVTAIQSDVPGLAADANNPELPKILHACGHNHTHAVSFATEAGIFQKQGFNAIICGPGSIAQAHKTDEFVEIDQLSQCLHFLEKLTA